MLHKHAATIRPYPLPTCQHAAARPNSRQIRQMSAMPANPPSQSQLAARPNNRRHHQPTAAHPPTTSTPNLSQTLMISHDLSSNTHTSAHAPAAPLPSRKSPQIPKITVQTIRPTQITAHPQYPKNHSSDNGQTLARPLVCSRRPSHPENLQKSCKSCFRQSAQSKPTTHPQYPMTSYKRCYYPLSTTTIHWCLLKTKNQKLKLSPHLPPPSQSSTISPIRPKPSRRTPICRFALSL